MRVGIIGAGNMGEAIIKGLRAKRRFSVNFYDKDRAKKKKIEEQYCVKFFKLEELIKKCKIIIICVKPQDIDALLIDLRGGINQKHTVISIAAGVTTSYIQKFFKSKIPVVRAMPNMPGMIGQGITACVLGKYAGKSTAKITRLIFSSIGKTLEIKNESKMDAVTAVSGSGPGFMAYLTQALKEAAVSVGLKEEEAEFLAVCVSSGTANMLQNEQISPMDLVRRVASKGGTTEAGLKVFNKRKIKTIITDAVYAAAKRSKELIKK
ncbi:MAG: pyrroline-5-carboxylate reductase [Candidatus Omnitrophica bacterium]|nr:pyrroline-5-carboxylate reductase [Candidatus Omnitrophota bacterium]MBU1925514.1 pyrroline-5-carboxylate reductase [Candidatus Omnitrophota bacterium]MBU2063527.1 pyrroline-5-carboxylate reductase [Candidatus Omnitrophota bacterium]